MTGYSSGLRKFRITILNRTEAVSGKYGLDSAGAEWKSDGDVWADVTWAKGKSAMNAGALDAYGVEMVRMNYNSCVNERSRIIYGGKTYQILPETFHVDKQSNTIQFHMQLVIND